MREGNDNSPIIIKKGKKHHGHHGGAWKVAYADFVTAMMALFIVLWVLGQDEEVVKNVAGYFQDPIGFTDKIGSLMDQQGGVSIAILDSLAERERERKEEIDKLSGMGEEIVEDLKSNPEFSKLVDQIKIEIADEGLRIEMVESANDVFFEIGTATLKSEAIKLLEKISLNLQKLPNLVVIEGHTDSRPYGSDIGYSNFELSSDRANAARRILIMKGLPISKIDEVRGYADTRLFDKKDPFSVVNRRISIIIKFKSEIPK